MRAKVRFYEAIDVIQIDVFDHKGDYQYAMSLREIEEIDYEHVPLVAGEEKSPDGEAIPA